MQSAPKSVHIGRIHGVGTQRLVPGHRPGQPQRPVRPRPGCTRHNSVARSYAQQLMEFLRGDRALHQLARVATDDIRADLNQLIRRRRLHRPALGSVFDFQPCPNVLEVSALLREGDRVHPVAFRLEYRSPRRSLGAVWIYTALRTPF